jgi:hypothetical protein
MSIGNLIRRFKRIRFRRRLSFYERQQLILHGNPKNSKKNRFSSMIRVNALKGQQ